MMNEIIAMDQYNIIISTVVITIRAVYVFRFPCTIIYRFMYIKQLDNRPNFIIDSQLPSFVTLAMFTFKSYHGQSDSRMKLQRYSIFDYWTR